MSLTDWQKRRQAVDVAKGLKPVKKTSKKKAVKPDSEEK